MFYIWIMQLSGLLQLGKLDGRLKNSSVSDIWSARMRLRAVTQSAANAGIGADAKDVEKWISGASLPPRYKEGLNDPIHITTIAHFAVATLNLSRCPIHKKSSAIWDPIFNASDEMLHWDAEAYSLYTPVWRTVRDFCLGLSVSPSVSSIADANLATLGRLKAALDAELPRIGHMNGVRAIPSVWITGLFVPFLVQKSGLTESLLPNFIIPVQFFDLSATEMQDMLISMIESESIEGLNELDRLEAQFSGSNPVQKLTKRSHYQTANKLKLAFPPLTRRRLASALGTTPQGAGYLCRQLQNARLDQPY